MDSAFLPTASWVPQLIGREWGGSDLPGVRQWPCQKLPVLVTGKGGSIAGLLAVLLQASLASLGPYLPLETVGNPKHSGQQTVKRRSRDTQGT
jgi:hypothetical protein